MAVAKQPRIAELTPRVVPWRIIHDGELVAKGIGIRFQSEDQRRLRVFIKNKQEAQRLVQQIVDLALDPNTWGPTDTHGEAK